MAYTVFLQATYPNPSGNSGIANVRLEAWLTDKVTGQQAGRKLSEVVEDDLVDVYQTKRYGRKSISAPGTTPAKFIVVLENLFDPNKAEQLSQRINFTPGKFYLNILLRDVTNVVNKAERLNIELPDIGGVGIEPQSVGGAVQLPTPVALGGTTSPRAFEVVSTDDITPPSQVTNLQAVPDNGSVALSWIAPATDYTGVRIVRKIGSYPTSPVEVGSNVVMVFDGTNEGSDRTGTFVDVNVINGITYYYRAFAHDAKPNYNTQTTGAQTTATPLDDKVNLVKGLVAVNGDRKVTLTWDIDDTENEVEGFVIFKSLPGVAGSLDMPPLRGELYGENETFPVGTVRSNSTVVYVGRDNTFVDTDVENGETYYYTIYAFDEASGGGPNYYNHGLLVQNRPASGSSGVYVEAKPMGAPTVLKVISTDRNTLKVIFDQSMDTQSIRNSQAYSIVDEEGFPLHITDTVLVETSTVEDNPNPRLDDTAVLRTEDQQPGVKYTVIVQ